MPIWGNMGEHTHTHTHTHTETLKIRCTRSALYLLRLGTVCRGQGLWPGTIYRLMGKGEVPMMQHKIVPRFFRYGRLEKQKLGLLRPANLI